MLLTQSRPHISGLKYQCFLYLNDEDLMVNTVYWGDNGKWKQRRLCAWPHF